MKLMYSHTYTIRHSDINEHESAKKSTHGQTHLTVKQASSSLPQRSSLQTDILRGDDLLGVCGVCACVCL